MRSPSLFILSNALYINQPLFFAFKVLPNPLSFMAREAREERASLPGVGCDPRGEDLWC